MGRSPCCSKEGLNRGAWTAKEDMILCEYIRSNGEGGWRSLPIKAGLKRCGKSCRLRWVNYLRPDIRRGNMSPDEVDLIIKMHRLLGNRWSLIAGRLPGRTDNEIKNYWNTRLSKKLAINEYDQHNSSQNLKTRSKSSSPSGQNRIFKTIPWKTTAVRFSGMVRTNCSQGDRNNSRSDQSHKVSDVDEITFSNGVTCARFDQRQ